MVNEMRRGTLEPPDPLADKQRRGHRDHKMHVIIRAPDLVHEDAGFLEGFRAQGTMGLRLDVVAENRGVVLDVPRDAQVDFAVGTYGHWLPLWLITRRIW